MSVRVMTWVWEHSQSKSTDRLVLLAIADCAADDGSNAFPSMKKLTLKTGLTDRGVQRSIARLVALGELKVALNAGPRGCNRYRVVMRPPTVVHPDPESPPTNSHPDEESPRPTVPPTEMHADPDPRSPGTALDPSKDSSSKSPRARTRGTRLPDSFTISPEMRDWAKEHVPQLAGAGETEKFIDYWRAQPGQRGVKLDWPATWRNWMRRAAERHPGSALVPANGAKPSTTDQRVAAGMQLAADLKRRREEAT